MEMTEEQREAYGKAHLTCTSHWIPETAFLAGWHAAQPRQLTDAKLFEMYDKACDEEVTHRSAVIAFGRAVESLLVQDVPPLREWKPMETAPKDGDEILLWNGDQNIGFWQSDKSVWQDVFGATICGARLWASLPLPPEAEPKR